MEIIRTHFEKIGSTNTWAKQNAGSFPKDKITLLTANEQTEGRGRFKRVWLSPSGLNIYATFCFFVNRQRLDIGNIPQVLAISAADAMTGFGFSPGLKWPNDILLSGKKAAGILCETIDSDSLLCVILGIGLNVNMPGDLLQSIDRPATSMYAEKGIRFSIEEVLKNLQDLFNNDLELFLTQGFSPFYARYTGYCVHKKGDLLHLADGRGVEKGLFESITENGALELRFSNGEKRQILSGEILYI